MENRLVYLIFFIISLVTCVRAWGQEGHKIVAQIAADQLSSSASDLVRQFCGSKSLPDISPLPDDYDHEPEGRWSEPCHFCNLPRSAVHFEMKYCPSYCVVRSILNYTNILHSEVSNPTACSFVKTDEPCSLEFLVHYIGDIHQPLHVSYEDDSGGNDVEVSFFGSKANLHEVWDTKIIQRWSSDYTSAVKELEKMIKEDPSLVQKYLNQMSPSVWADESFQFVRTTCYNYTTNSDGVGQLGEDYYQRNLPIIQQRLIAGGVRLGQLLNTTLKSISSRPISNRSLAEKGKQYFSML